MKEQLIGILEALGYPAYLQGTLDPDEPYPDSFFTFWNFDTPEAAFYDNAAGRAEWGFYVLFYSTDPALVETVPETARKALKKAGWILDGKAHDADVQRPTHTGAYFTVYGTENYESEE